MTCFDKDASKGTSFQRRLTLYNQNRNTKLELVLTSVIFLISTSHSLPLFLFFSVFVFLSFLSLGGGEDYRQNPAESHKSTEGESVFWPHGNINLLVTALMDFPLVTPVFLPLFLLFELRMCCFT